MPFCPRCKFEYNVTELVCPECHEVLRDSLADGSQSATSPDDSWVVVGGVEQGYELETARTSLDSNNIPSVMMSPVLHIPVRGVMLDEKAIPESGEGKLIMVPREFQDEAMLVLRSVFGEDFGISRMVDF